MNTVRKSPWNPDPRPEPRVLWPGHWSLFANASQPPGADSDVVDDGLFEPPRL